jgi:hypothetical protein
MTGPAVNPISSGCVNPKDPASAGKIVSIMVRRSDDGERHGGSDMTVGSAWGLSRRLAEYR